VGVWVCGCACKGVLAQMGWPPSRSRAHSACVTYWPSNMLQLTLRTVSATSSVPALSHPLRPAPLPTQQLAALPHDALQGGRCLVRAALRGLACACVQAAHVLVGRQRLPVPSVVRPLKSAGTAVCEQGGAVQRRLTTAAKAGKQIHGCARMGCVRQTHAGPTASCAPPQPAAAPGWPAALPLA